MKKYNFLFYSNCTEFNYIPSPDFYSIINRLKSITGSSIIIDGINYHYKLFTKEDFIYYYENIDVFIDKYFYDLGLNNIKIDFFIANNMWFNESVPEIILVAKALKKRYSTKVFLISEFAKYYGDYLSEYYGNDIDYLFDGGDARSTPEEYIYGKIIGNEEHFIKYLENLDEVNGYNQSPDFSFVYGKTDIIEFEISRGCRTFPKCFYCGASYTKSMHSRSIKENERLLNEFKNNGIKKLYFVCNEINFNNLYLDEFLNMMIKNKYDFKWSSYTLAKDLPKKLIKKMYKAGCRHVKIGIESVYPSRALQISKRLNISELEEIIRNFHNAGIIVQGHFMYNFKDETIEELKYQMKFIIKNKEYLDIVDFHHLKFRPRSKDFEKIYKFHYPIFKSNNDLGNYILNLDKYDIPFVQDNLYIDSKGEIKKTFYDLDNIFLNKTELLKSFLYRIGKGKEKGNLGTDPKKFFINYK